VAAQVVGSVPDGCTGDVQKLSEPGWFEVCVTVVGSEEERPAEAEARAKAKARAKVAEFAGVRVKSNLLSFEQLSGMESSKLLQEVIAIQANALVVEEKPTVVGRDFLSEGAYRLSLRWRGRLLDRRNASDSGFRVSLDLGRTRSAREGRPRFLVGDEMTLTISATQEAQIQVLGIHEGGAAVLLPNRCVRDPRVKPGVPLVFPNELDRRRCGIRLIAMLPQGQDRALETLIVVATRGESAGQALQPSGADVFLSVESSGAGVLLREFVQPLIDLSPDDSAFDQIAYEILAR
jgi:hypothetical protein